MTLRISAHTSILRLAFGCLVALSTANLLSAQDANLPGAIEAGGNADLLGGLGAGTADDGESQQQAQQRQQFSDALLKELDNMVPGEFADDSPQKKALEEVVDAFLKGDGKAVSEILQNQAKLDPDFPPQGLMMAAMSYIVRDQRSGRALLEQAAVSSPDYPGTYAAFARLALNEGRITDAMALLEKCAKAVRDNEISDKSREHFSRQFTEGMIEVAAAQGRFEDARKLLDYQLGKDPDNSKSLLTGAELEFKADRLDISQSYLEKLKTVLPQTRPYQSIFANWFARTGKQDEAGKWIDAAAQTYPNDSAVQLDYAKWMIALEQFVACETALTIVEKSEGKTPATEMMRGQIAFANQKYDVAAEIFEEVVKQQPGSVEAANLFALSLVELDDAAKQALAQQVATENFRRSSKSLLTAATLGYVQLAQGDVKSAQQVLMQVARNRQITAEIAYFIGKLSVEIGETEQARNVLKSSLNEKRLFLYRKSARALLDSLGDGNEQMPDPSE